MLFGNFPGCCGVTIFYGVDHFTKVVVVFLQLGLVHGQESVAIAMDIVVNGVENGDIHRIAGNPGHGHVDLLIDINEGVSLGSPLFYAVISFVQQIFQFANVLCGTVFSRMGSDDSFHILTELSQVVQRYLL